MYILESMYVCGTRFATHKNQNRKMLGLKKQEKDLLVGLQFGVVAEVLRDGGGLGSSTIFKKFNEPYAPS